MPSGIFAFGCKAGAKIRYFPGGWGREEAKKPPRDYQFLLSSLSQWIILAVLSKNRGSALCVMTKSERTKRPYLQQIVLVGIV